MNCPKCNSTDIMIERGQLEYLKYDGSLDYSKNVIEYAYCNNCNYDFTDEEIEALTEEEA